jgi:hypothetical protein
MYIREDGKRLDPEKVVCCGYCDDRYRIKDLHHWSGDDRPQLLCPGCDETLIVLRSPDDDETYEW